MKRSTLSLLGVVFLSAALTACGGGGSDSATPTPEPAPTPAPEPTPTPAPEPEPSSPAVKVGDFELVAGTLDTAAPADAPRCQNGPALGVYLRDPPVYSDIAGTVFNAITVGSNGHIYGLRTDCDPLKPRIHLVEINPSTGQMRVQPIPSYLDGNSQDTPALLSFPRAIAAASDGSVLIADPGVLDFASRFPGGIWRFKDGVLSKVAGFDHSVPLTEYQTTATGCDWTWHCTTYVVTEYSYGFGQDGKGGEATFSYDLPGFMCAGPNDTFYILETAKDTPKSDVGGAYRRISLDGTVKTISRLDKISGNNNVDLVCAANKRVFTALGAAYGVATYSDLVSGETFNSTSLHGGAVLYGFGDSLFIYRESILPPTTGGTSITDTFFFVDLKRGGIKSKPWIQVECRAIAIGASCSSPTAADFQLNSMPYRMPRMLQNVVGIDSNNFAYIYAGNALLRYKLPNSVQPN